MAWRGLHVTVNEAFSGFPALQETMSEDTDRQSIAQLCDIFLEGFDLSIASWIVVLVKVLSSTRITRSCMFRHVSQCHCNKDTC
jgi:hypothetical protein